MGQSLDRAHRHRRPGGGQTGQGPGQGEDDGGQHRLAQIQLGAGKEAGARPGRQGA